MIYLYGLLEPGARIRSEDLATLDGVMGPVAVCNLGTVQLAHAVVDEVELLPKRRYLLAHARVLEALSMAGTILPMRFGMTAESPKDIASILDARGTDIQAQFDAVRGCAEFGIRVSFPRDAALAATLEESPQLLAERARLMARGPQRRSETIEFGRRLGERLDRRRAATQRSLLAALSPEFSNCILRTPDDDVQVLAIDALVPANRWHDLAQRIEAAARDCGFAPGAEPQVRLVGPGPAYSFVRLSLDPARRAA